MSNTNPTFEEALAASLNLANEAARERNRRAAEYILKRAQEEAQARATLPALAEAEARSIVADFPRLLRDAVERGTRVIGLYSVDRDWSAYDDEVARQLLSMFTALKVPVKFEHGRATGRDMCNNLCTGDAGRVYYVLP